MGQIRTSPGKTTYTVKHGERHWKPRIMKTRGKSESGYRVGLWKNGQPKDFLFARVIAMTWVDGYEEGMTVNHKNGNRFDNRAENLEWLSLADNIRHGFETGLYHSMKEVTLQEIDTGKTIKFKSMVEASQFLGRSKGYVSYCTKNNNLRANGKYYIKTG